MARKRKLHTYCCVPQCTSKEDEDLSFHCFPRNNKLRFMQWLLKLRIGKPPTEYMHVCSKHFNRDDFFSPAEKMKRRRLKSIAIPSRNLPVCPFDSTQNEEQELDGALKSFQEIENLKNIAVPSRCPFDKTQNEEQESVDAVENFQETKEFFLKIITIPSRNLPVCSLNNTQDEEQESNDAVKSFQETKNVKIITIPSRNSPVSPFYNTQNEEQDSDDAVESFQETKNSRSVGEKSTVEDGSTVHIVKLRPIQTSYKNSNRLYE